MGRNTDIIYHKFKAPLRLFISIRNLMIHKTSHPCLTISELIYALFHTFDKLGDYRINIILTFYPTGERGHAWVTRNNKKFLLHNHSIEMSKYCLIGENKKYRYFVKTSNLEKMHTYDRLFKK